MQLPKLTPLQARLLASVIATCVLVVIWIEFQPKYFVYASELPAAPEDGLHSQFGHAIPQNEESIQTGEGKREEQAQIREKQHGESGYSVTIEGQGGNGAQEDVGYMPDFAYFDRSLIGRQKEQVTNLTNNVKDERDSSEGVTTHFVLPKSQLKIKREEEGPATHAELNTRETENISKKGVDEEAETEEEHIEKRQNTQRVWISANACRQPLPTTELITESNSPQLILYVSTSTKNQKPGPKSKNDLAADPIVFEGGYANFLVQTDSDIFIGVEAPLLTDGWAGSWHFEIAASTDGYYHGYHADETFLFMVDTDSESALFITPNITAGNDTAEIKKWSDMDPLPFVIYTQPTAKWGPMTGLERSFCALETALNNTGKITVKSTITTNFGDAERNLGKAQFHVQGLENGTAYQGFLAINGTKEGLVIPGVGLVKNGGQVWRQFNWTTKADDSCQVIFDLEFCSDIAYAVPSSLKFKTNTTALVEQYDRLAADYYKNFTNSLEQVACDTTGTAQYSLARTCEDCRVDYKTWLCSVLMPRCEDFSATDPWLQPRNIGVPFANGSLPFADNTTVEFKETMRDRLAFNTSRNPMINTDIQPGPYKELLPCETMCFAIVRSCPAVLGFSCPNEPARSLTYGKKTDHALTCNFPGAVVDLNVAKGGAGARVVEIVMVIVVAVAVGVWFSL